MMKHQGVFEPVIINFVVSAQMLYGKAAPAIDQIMRYLQCFDRLVVSCTVGETDKGWDNPEFLYHTVVTTRRPRPTPSCFSEYRYSQMPSSAEALVL